MGRGITKATTKPIVKPSQKLPFKPAFPVPGMHPEDSVPTWRDCTSLSTAALSQQGDTGQEEIPSPDEWTIKHGNIPSKETQDQDKHCAISHTQTLTSNWIII